MVKKGGDQFAEITKRIKQKVNQNKWVIMLNIIKMQNEYYKMFVSSKMYAQNSLKRVHVLKWILKWTFFVITSSKKSIKANTEFC